MTTPAKQNYSSANLNVSGGSACASFPCSSSQRSRSDFGGTYRIGHSPLIGLLAQSAYVYSCGVLGFSGHGLYTPLIGSWWAMLEYDTPRKVGWGARGRWNEGGNYYAS